MATVRIFLLTYRRPALLPRALQSLLRQTYTDWVCELHNDDPADAHPARLVAALGDRRVTVHTHERNWGALASFNHVFAASGPEAFTAILEDDNWWEADFLSTAVAALETHGDAALVWSNQRIWEEAADGTWRDTGRTIWYPEEGRATVQRFEQLELLQAFDALYSNGAVVFRRSRFDWQPVPPDTPLAIIETLRERAATGPLLLLRRPLGNFAVTRQSARRQDATEWAQAKLLVAASALHQREVPDAAWRQIWEVRRRLRPRDTDIFFHAALALGRWELLRPAALGDLVHWAVRVLRHPRRWRQIMAFRESYPEVWGWLLARQRTTRTLAATVLDKQGMPNATGMPDRI